MTFDVSMRLRLINDASKEAKKLKGDLEDVGNAAKKLGNARTGNLDKGLGDVGRKASAAGKDVKGLQKDLDKLGKAKIDASVGRQIDGMVKPTGNLGKVMGVLGSAAAGAFAGLMAFASVDNIIRGLERLSEQYRKLNRDIASVAVTAEMRTPEAMDKIGKSNERLSIRYGLGAGSVNAARKTYAAAGIGLDQQEAILDPTLKSAKAADSTGETIGSAVIALQQNLGVKDGDVAMALDMLAKGTKLGSFEVDAMAKNFPKLATLYGGTGRSGLDATAELVALAQIVRMGAGSQDQASTNLENILAKLSSPDTVKNFEKKGVDIEALRKRSEKRGTPYMIDLIDKVMEMTGGDEFRIGELFGDLQAKQALMPLINNREKFSEFHRIIRNEAGGTVDADYEFLRGLPQERADRRAAAYQATGDKLGGAWATATDPLRDRMAGWVNPDFAAQEGAATRNGLKQLGAEELQRRIADIEKSLAGLPDESLDFLVPAVKATRLAGRDSMAELKSALDEINGVDTPAGPSGFRKFMFGKAAEDGFSLKDQLGINLRGTAESAMQGYNEGLAAEGEKAAAEAMSIAERIKAILGFTVSPTIAPNFTPPAAAPATGEKHSSLQQSSNVKLTQNISSPNPKLAAIRSRREQGRAIQQAQARSLYDVGRMPA